MKKLVSICFALILLTCAAGAANVGTIDNGYPGDTEAQAQMLCDLGLFRGTENGFELEKPMTRAEAAAMLTRLLGAEQEALTTEREHPFTDVPQWADPYVGWLLTEDRVQPMAIHGSVFTERAGGVLVTQSITAGRTEVCTWTPDGQPIDSVTVPNDVPVSPGQSESLRLFYAPDLSNCDEECLWGGVGLYQEQDGRLTRITARPAFDYARDPADGSYVIVTHAPGRLIQYEEGAVVYRTGDTLVRLLPDGTEQPLLPALPEGSLLIDTVHILPDGRVEFTTMRPTEPHKMGRLTCVLEDGKVTVTDATADIFYMHGEDYVEREQARLDALGIGAGA